MVAVLKDMIPSPPAADCTPEAKIDYLIQCLRSGGNIAMNYGLRALAAQTFTAADAGEFKHARDLLAAGKLTPLDQMTFANLLQMRLDELMAAKKIDALRGKIPPPGERLLTRVTVEGDEEEPVAYYVMDHNDTPQRIVLMDQIHNALLANQSVYVHPEFEV